MPSIPAPARFAPPRRIVSPMRWCRDRAPWPSAAISDHPIRDWFAALARGDTPRPRFGLAAAPGGFATAHRLAKPCQVGAIGAGRDRRQSHNCLTAIRDGHFIPSLNLAQPSAGVALELANSDPMHAAAP